MKRRTVVVPDEFYLQLLGYLRPTERWLSNAGLLLLTYDTDNKTQVMELEFVPQEHTR